LRDITRAAVALTVVALSILATSFTFIAYYGQVFQAPPLLNTNMQYWTIDPTKNLTTPYLWTIDLIQGPTDNGSVFRAVVGGRNALGLRVVRTNANNSQIWTTVHVRQDVHGQALGAIFKANITLDVFPTFQYLYNPQTKNPENAFGIEINDGTNLIWYLFADEPSQVVQLPHHRIILTQTPLNAWSTRSLNISSQYAAAGWDRPVSISFTFIIGTTWLHIGNWVGYFSNLSVSVPTLQIQRLSSTQTLTVFMVDAVAIIFLAAVFFVYRNRTNANETSKTHNEVRDNVR
jgi:hypothetical protein